MATEQETAVTPNSEDGVAGPDIITTKHRRLVGLWALLLIFLIPLAAMLQ